MYKILFFLLLPIAAFAGCPFCDPKVVASQSVYENELFYVLVDYAPAVKGHLLAIPKRHIMKAHEMTKEEWSGLSDVIPKTVQVFQQAYSTDQYLILEKNGPFAGQTVPHVHFHLLPMPTNKIGDTAKATLFGKIFNQLPTKLSPDEMHREVERLKKYFSVDDK